MDFDEKAFLDMLRLLQEKPELREALRQVLLTEAILSLPAQMEELIQTVREGQIQIQQLTQIVREGQLQIEQLTQIVHELAQAVQEGQAQIQWLTQTVQSLIQTVQSLTQIVQEGQAQIQWLTQTVQSLTQTVQEGQAQIQWLTQTVQSLTQTVQEGQAQIQQLTQTVRELTEAQKRTEERQQRIEEGQERLEKAQKRTEQRLDKVTADVEVLKADVATLKQDMKELNTTVGDLVGDSLERRYRERAASYFQKFIRRVRVLSSQQLCEILDDALDSGVITLEERNDTLLADVVARGRRETEECYLLAEVSQSVHKKDVQRALQRARVLERVVQAPVIAVVAGNKVAPSIRRIAKQLGVEVVVNGTAVG